MSEGTPLRDEAQRETTGALIERIPMLGNWIAGNYLRAGATLLFVVAIVSLLARPTVLVDLGTDYLELLGKRDETVRVSIQSDKNIYGLMRRQMHESQATRGVIKIFLFDSRSEQRLPAMVESHELMDRLGERTGLRNRVLRKEDVQGTLDIMFPGPGVPARCITRRVGAFPDHELNDFLEQGGYIASSACPIVELDGQPIGLLAFSTRNEMANLDDFEKFTRDTANMLSGYLAGSANVAAAREGEAR